METTVERDAVTFALLGCDHQGVGPSGLLERRQTVGGTHRGVFGVTAMG